MQLKLSRELGHGHGKPVVPHVVREPSEKQQGGAQEAEEGKTGTSWPLQDDKDNNLIDDDNLYTPTGYITLTA